MNINERFLLEVLNHTTHIFRGKDTESFYFSPTGFDFEIKIPYGHSTSQINIHFVYYPDSDNRISEKHTINFSFDSPDKIKEFMNEFYRKYECTLNEEFGGLPSTEVMTKFENMIKYPYPVSGIDDGDDEDIPYIQDRNWKESFHMEIHEALFVSREAIKFKPLEPIIIPCYHSGDSTEKKYKKVVPAYLVNNYPTLAQFAKLVPVVNNVKDFADILNSLKLMNPKSESVLNALILEDELANKANTKNSRPKI